MLATTILPETAVVQVRLGLGRDRKPYARPNSCEAWFRSTDRDTVSFTCADEFTIRFDKGDGSPFDDEILIGVGQNGFFEIEAALRANVEERTYAYSLTVGETIDPDIVVKRDPR